MPTPSLPAPPVPVTLNEKGHAELARLGHALSSQTSANINDVLTHAADRLEKAARLMEQLQDLHKAASLQGFKGTSASQVIAFAQERLQEGSRSQAVAQMAKACEALDPELAFDEGHMEGSERLLGSCLRVIRASSVRLVAQDTAIVALVGARKAQPGGWDPLARDGAEKVPIAKAPMP